jgi:hypothetical protein
MPQETSIINNDLKLSDYKKIWTKFCFLDESGSLNAFNPREPFFTVGFLKCSQPYYIASKIVYERDRRQFYDEMKFNKLSRKNLDFAKFVLDALFSTKSLHFCSYTLDKEGKYFNEQYGGDPWKAYEDISIKVLGSSIRWDEILIVVADYVTTPKDIRFEVNVKRRLNEKLNRLAIAGVCRFDSKSNDLLQLADLLVGAISYDLKLVTKLIVSGDKYKKRLLAHFKTKLEIPTSNFTDGFRDKLFKFNIFVDKDVKKRLAKP